MSYELTGLEGKIAVVTGAGRMRSIGRSIALELAKAGCDVVITGSGRSPDAFPDDEKKAGWRDIESVAEEIRALGRRALPLISNVADLEAVKLLADKVVQEFGRVDFVINNAGAAQSGGFIEQSTDSVAQLVALNTTALVRLASAITPRLAAAGNGAIINIGSVVGLAPEFGMTVYGATKAFVLFLSQGMSLELAPKGVYVQAVLPAATRTEIWERAGIDINTLTDVMEVGDLVDAALVGFDRREPVTIPPLQDGARWDALQAARQGLLAQIKQSQVAERYLANA